MLEHITLARLSSTTVLPRPQICLQVPLIHTSTLPLSVDEPECSFILPCVQSSIQYASYNALYFTLAFTYYSCFPIIATMRVIWDPFHTTTL